MAQGLLSHLAISPQNSFGTITTSYRHVPIISESLAVANAILDEGNLRARLGEAGNIQGLQTVAGDIQMQPHMVEIGHFLYGLTNQDSTSVTATSLTQHLFYPATALFDDYAPLKPYTLQVHRNSALAWQLQDCIVNRLEFNISQGQLLTVTAGIIGRVSSLVAAGTPSFRAPNSLWTFNQASISLGGAANADFESLIVNVERQVEAVPTLDGKRWASRFALTGPYMVRVSGTMDFRVQSVYADFDAFTRRVFQAAVISMVTSGPNIIIDVPQLLFESFDAPVSGPGRVKANFTARGEFDSSSNYAVQFTLINSIANAYSTP